MGLMLLAPYIDTILSLFVSLFWTAGVDLGEQSGIYYKG
jgi:hypothetical protein